MTDAPMTAKQAMDIGYMIAEDHDRALRSIASEYFPDIPINSLTKLIHGNKVWLAAQIMRAMQEAEARAPAVVGEGKET